MSLRVGDPIPSFAGNIDWLNQQGANALTRQPGPILVFFWAISCGACLYNMPNVQRWQEAYGPYGLRSIAVHLPRGPEDTNVDLVREAVQAHGITCPCAVDNDWILAKRFDTGEVWPYYFLFDAEGRLRSRAAGGMGLRLLEGALKRYFAAMGIEAAASR